MPATAKPPRRIPEGYGTRSLQAMRAAVLRGMRLAEDGTVILASGQRPSDRVDRDGYRSVNLALNGKGCKVSLCRVVCFLAHGEPPHPGCVADHINGDKTNDRPDNLRWATYSENLSNNAANRASGVSPQRIKACLEACAGIEDPTAAIKAAREALATALQMIPRGEHDSGDSYETSGAAAVRVALRALGGITIG